MKLYYIRNTKTDKNFDTNENKFFANNWTPEYEEDRDYLQSLIDDDKERFQNCIVEEIEL